MTITLQSHGLRFEGAPHDEAGNRITRGFGPPGIGGSGRAKCGCGTLSPVLPSAYQRKQWHRAHKADEWAKANGVIPVRLEDGERIGNARLNDDGTVTVYVLRPDILDKVTDHFDSYSLGPTSEVSPGFRREVQKMAEDMAASRVTKPIIITGI